MAMEREERHPTDNTAQWVVGVYGDRVSVADQHRPILRMQFCLVASTDPTFEEDANFPLPPKHTAAPPLDTGVDERQSSGSAVCGIMGRWRGRCCGRRAGTRWTSGSALLRTRRPAVVRRDGGPLHRLRAQRACAVVLPFVSRGKNPGGELDESEKYDLERGKSRSLTQRSSGGHCMTVRRHPSFQQRGAAR